MNTIRCLAPNSGGNVDWFLKKCAFEFDSKEERPFDLASRVNLKKRFFF